MFKSLIQAVFPSFVDQDFIPDYVSFERGRRLSKAEQDIAEKLASAGDVQADKRVNTNPFYDYLFGDSKKANSQDQLSLYVASKLAEVLYDPTDVLNALPIKPNSLVKVMSLIGSAEFDLSELLTVIEQEPSMAAEIIKLANSTRYKRGSKEVTDLHKAFMYMGAEGLKAGVIEVHLKRFASSSNLYFKLFGEKIWAHSLNSATYAQQLALKSLPKEQAPSMYLVGLLKNLGDMVIFQLMIDAFKYVDPDAKPDSEHFKILMAENSHKLTVLITKHWQLPQHLIEVLIELGKDESQFSDEAKCIYDASNISEYCLMLKAKRITEAKLLDLQHKTKASVQAIELAKEILDEAA